MVLLGLAVVGLVAVWWRHRRRQTVYLRMSDAWLRDHADDPWPEHLR